MTLSRRNFLKAASVLAGSAVMPLSIAEAATGQSNATQDEVKADYTIRIAASPVEISPKKIISTTTYNGQFPGPLLRFKEGQRVTVDIFNDTDTPEQLHWHGQFVPVDVDGAAEEGTPFIPARGKRRISFVPQPSGFRFYHTHNRAGADLAAGQYSGQVGPVYIEPKHEPGRYDREVFLVLKEFEPTFSRGGDMAIDALAPATRVKALEDQGESAMKASLAKGMPQGLRGRLRLLHHQRPHARPRRARAREAGRARSLSCAQRQRHRDSQPRASRSHLPRRCARWQSRAESRQRSCPLAGHRRARFGYRRDESSRRVDHGRYSPTTIAITAWASSSNMPGARASRLWVAPPKFRWNYTHFAKPGATAPLPDETFDMTFVKDNAALDGFNKWTINGVAYPLASMMAPASFHLKQGRRYRLHMRNASDDIHPIHLHRHSFELTNIAGVPTAGVMKDVVMLGGYQEIAVDFVANNPGMTLFHCHQQLHMDFGFMTLFDYVA